MTSRNEFCSKLQDPVERLKSRLLFVSRNDFPFIRVAYKDDVGIVSVSDYVTSDGFIPAPERVFADMGAGFGRLLPGRIPFVIGLDGYFSLLRSDLVVSAFECMRRLLDGVGGRSALFHLEREWEGCEDVFSNPRYVQNGQIVKIGGPFPKGLPASGVRLVDLKWGARRNPPCKKLQDYLKEIEKGIAPDEEVAVSVSFNGSEPFPQVNESVRQLCSAKDWYQHLLGPEWDLPNTAFLWIDENFRDFSGYDSLREHFFPEGSGALLEAALKRLAETELDDEFDVLRFYLRKKLPGNSYLAYVMGDPNISGDTVVDTYICKIVENLDTPHASVWREERKRAVRELPKQMTSTGIGRLISLLKGKPAASACRWLNFGTPREETEFVRRAILCEDADSDEMRVIRKSCPDLDAYLASCPTSYEKIDDYLDKYRRLKIHNSVPFDFVGEAYEHSAGWDGLKSRTEALTDCRKPGDAVLIVDAMGGEYLPMLYMIAKKMHIGISEASLVHVELPTATEFNKVENSEKLNGLDAICHNGVKLHESATDEENLAGELSYVRDKVIPAVQERLASRRRVILTADHGTSRLAVLAYLKNLAETIGQIDGVTPAAWRMAEINKPDQIIKNRDTVGNLWNTHLSVKGYNRFKYPGGCGFEIHGGATIEEGVVPFIVFEKGAVYELPVRDTRKAADRQLIENDDFDI